MESNRGVSSRQFAATNMITESAAQWTVRPQKVAKQLQPSARNQFTRSLAALPPLSRRGGRQSWDNLMRSAVHVWCRPQCDISA